MAERKLALRPKCDWPIPTCGWPSASYPGADKITALAMSDNGSQILTGTDKGEMTIWDASRVEFGDAVYGAYTWQNSLSFDERLLGTSGSSAGRRSVGIWDREGHREILRLPSDRFGNSADEMRGVAFHPAAPLIATVNMDGNLQFWNRTDGTAVSSARMPSNASLLFVAFDRTGEHIIVADNEHSLWIAEVKAVEKPLQIDIGGMPMSIAVASDADVVATVGIGSKEVKLWDVKSGKIKSVVAERDAVDTVSISSNATTLATASGNVVRLWDLASGKPTGEVFVHDQSVNHVAFSPDGDFIAVATGITGTDGTTGAVHIWNLRSREQLSVIPHAEGVRDVIFSAHPPRVLTASGWQVDEWTWQPADLIAEACKRLTRPLSEEEWKAYVGTTSYSPACGSVR